MRYAEHLRTIGATSSAVAYISFLVLALRAMVPGEDWAWVQQVARRLKHLAVPVRDKRPRLSKTGSAYGADAYYAMVIERTVAHFGTSLSPHLFRDCAASSIANENPEDIRIIMSILGHSTMKTAEDRYIHAQTVVAARKHQNHVQALRAGAKARQRRGGGTSSHSET